MEKIRIDNLSFTYPDRRSPALDSLDLSVEKGDFLLICGKSGCGKTTLLRQMKTVLTPNGTKTGEILLDGKSLDEMDLRSQASAIGFVQQSPENQIVTDQVWHELAFGLESLGEDAQTIRRKVAEMSSFFGLEDLFYHDTASLSGGQKQLVNLAAVMTMQPSVLILDEPTSQLDPIAASDFFAILGKINRELGVTILLTEHRPEEAFACANKIAYMENGKILHIGTPKEIGENLRQSDYFSSMPTAMRIWAAIPNHAECPVTVSEGSRFLSQFAETNSLDTAPITDKPTQFSDVMLRADKLWFRYEKDGADIVKGLDLSLHKGEFFALLGGNGVGKTTTLKLLAGIEKPYRGSIVQSGKIGILPQNPQALFVKKTVHEDLLEFFSCTHIPQDVQAENVRKIAEICHIEQLLDAHPYDLSGGEQQRAALAKILLTSPDILLLDEPTKGMDAQFKAEFADILLGLLSEGKSVCMVSHDIEFCAEYADRCALFFDGSITSVGAPHAFFSGNSFYTTAASRMSRHILPNAVTVQDVVKACGGNVPTAKREQNLPEISDEKTDVPRSTNAAVYIDHTYHASLPAWRKIAAAVFGAVSLVIFFYTASITDLTEIISPNGATTLAGKQLLIYGALILSLFLTFLAIGKRTDMPTSTQIDHEKRKLSKRTKAAAAMLLLAVPLTLFIGIFYLGSRKYNIISLFILAECMLPFFVMFEKKHPSAREIAVIATLCAIAVAGRAAFFMLPQFKPVMAVTIIAGAAFGGETGFLVGAVAMLVSNILFSQGPWTPWQMFAMGMVGFWAGILFQKGFLRKTRLSLAIFGAVSAIVIYGGIMNPASALIWSTEKLSRQLLLTYYLAGFPMDCIHAFSTAFFLWAAAEPMLEKLCRIQTKYGIIDP